MQIGVSNPNVPIFPPRVCTLMLLIITATTSSFAASHLLLMVAILYIKIIVDTCNAYSMLELFTIMPSFYRTFLTIQQILRLPFFSLTRNRNINPPHAQSPCVCYFVVYRIMSTSCMVCCALSSLYVACCLVSSCSRPLFNQSLYNQVFIMLP